MFSVALGICGGGICGAAILSFGDLIGRTCSTGDHIGSWNVADLALGAIYGAPLGAIAALIAYAALVRKSELDKRSSLQLWVRWWEDSLAR